MSDEIIVGEVIAQLDTFYSNPDRKIKELENAEITPYVVTIEKAYKGLLKEGDTVVISAWNHVGIYPEDKDNYSQIISDQKDFYLRKGQRGVFMLRDSEYLKTKDGQPMYNVVFEDEGVFEEKISGNAAAGEELKKTYVSPSFEITLDQIPADIQKADRSGCATDEGRKKQT